MHWAPRIKEAQIRRLYYAERRGLVEEEPLLAVGWALYVLCQNVVAAVTGLQLGEVPCPECDQPVQRTSVPAPTERQRAALFRVHHRVGWFHCQHCQQRLLWRDCRDALRQQPRCFACDTRLHKSKDTLACRCGKAWSVDQYRASVGRRTWLPCPHCRQRLQRPTFASHPLDEAPAENDPTPVFRCSKCQGLLARAGALLVCGGCGHQVRWRSYKKSLKRRDETLTCQACSHAFGWQDWRKKALQYSTGNPSPAVEFIKHWPASKTVRQRMMRIDLLVQALHGQGALAPVFIEGTKESVRQMLDELAAQS